MAEQRTIREIAVEAYGDEDALLLSISRYAEASSRIEGITAPSYAYAFNAKPRRLPKLAEPSTDQDS